jgi:hypothetical protein
MTWFKVDDTLGSHPKARAAGLAAMGLWVVAGAWSSQHLTEGFVPDWYVNSWPSGQKRAANLVQSGLWIEEDSGFRFHQWDERNPSKEQVESERAAARERQRRHRESKRDAGVSHGVTDGVTNRTPTRPDPTRSSSGTTSGGPKPEKPASIPRSRGVGTRIPDPFIIDEAMKDWAVDRGYTAEWCIAQTERFVNYWTAKPGKDGTKSDWRATWRNWILKAADDLPTNKKQGDLFDRAMERAQNRLEIVQ